MKTHPLNPQRLRYIPPQFSWVDHRLVRQGHLQRCDHSALSLYLFYLTVADALGMSYYSDARLRTALSMTQHQLCVARQGLVTQDLIAYERPLVQVLSLDKIMRADMPKKKARVPVEKAPQTNQKPLLVATITDPKKLREYLETLRAQIGGHHD